MEQPQAAKRVSIDESFAGREHVPDQRGKEDLLIEATAKPELCQVRTGTENPCQGPASVKIRGVPFCEACAREQEAYFTIGELTDYPQGRAGDGTLIGVLNRTWRIRRSRATADHEPDAA
jgi:hypothetical protein